MVVWIRFRRLRFWNQHRSTDRNHARDRLAAFSAYSGDTLGSQFFRCPVWAVADGIYGNSRKSSLKSLPVRVFLSRNRTVFLTWLLGVLVFAFMALQSVTIYQFQTEQTAKEWTSLKPDQISQWGTALSLYHPSFLAIFFADSHSENFRSGLDEVFNKAHWPQATVMNAGNGIGITVRARSDESGAITLIKFLKDAGYTAALDPDETRAGVIQIYIGHKPPS
jgi:hypothetical protein